ncbi:hypothetical protein WR25_02287 [Diploscapter pachys]|uniref:Uncharacterized protein n=1 Tax=Diploscapter pachys TaxID=2018661 RepID=A0A2A2KHM9_9BILA|nr:hypothetical protein WR25_02287 [Diploscapter pachys]
MSKPSRSCEQDQAPVDTSDIPELDDDFFRRAELRVPAKQTVTIRLDADVLTCVLLGQLAHQACQLLSFLCGLFRCAGPDGLRAEQGCRAEDAG